MKALALNRTLARVSAKVWLYYYWYLPRWRHRHRKLRATGIQSLKILQINFGHAATSIPCPLQNPLPELLGKSDDWLDVRLKFADTV